MSQLQKKWYHQYCCCPIHPDKHLRIAELEGSYRFALFCELGDCLVEESLICASHSHDLRDKPYLIGRAITSTSELLEDRHGNIDVLSKTVRYCRAGAHCRDRWQVQRMNND